MERAPWMPLVILMLQAPAWAYTLSVNSRQVLGVPQTAGTATFTVSITPEPGDPQIISAQALLQVAAPLTVGTASVPSSSAYANASSGWTSNAFNVDMRTRGRLLFAPVDEESNLPIPAPVVATVLFQLVVNYPAGLGGYVYPVTLLLADTYVSDPVNTRVNPSSVVNGALLVDIPEPASALLLMTGLFWIRRH